MIFKWPYIRIPTYLTRVSLSISTKQPEIILVPYIKNMFKTLSIKMSLRLFSATIEVSKLSSMKSGTLDLYEILISKEFFEMLGNLVKNILGRCEDLALSKPFSQSILLFILQRKYHWLCFKFSQRVPDIAVI